MLDPCRSGRHDRAVEGYGVNPNGGRFCMGCQREAKRRNWRKSHPNPIHERRRTIPPGTAFGMLTVMAPAGAVSGHARYLCACECGNVAEVNGPWLQRGEASCGCQRRALARAKGLAGKKPPEHHRRNNRIFHQRLNSESRAWATRNGQLWTGPEIDTALRRDLSAREVSMLIGRTLAAVNTMRQNCKKEDPRYAEFGTWAS